MNASIEFLKKRLKLNQLFFFSQFLPNKSLDALLNKSAPSINWSETKKLINIFGIASAMSFLHSHDIAHGYLHPKNILFDDHKGIVGSKNETEAFRYFKMSADHGYIASFFVCGGFLCYGIGVPVDMNKGIQYLKIAADKKNPIVMFLYAIFMTKKLQNRIISPHIAIPIFNECIRYFKMSADNGVVKGMIVYGNILADESFLPFNLREAAYYYKMAADKGGDSDLMTYVKYY